MKTGGRDSAIFSHFNGYRPLGLGQGYPHPELIKEEMQALPGAANSGTCTYSVGYVRKNPFLVSSLPPVLYSVILLAIVSAVEQL